MTDQDASAHQPQTEEEAELRADLSKIGLADEFAVLIMKAESLSVMGIGMSVIVMPLSLLLPAFKSGAITEEVMALGLREATSRMRQAEPTVLLAETLLSLSRASEGADSFENRLDMATEAILILKRLAAHHRLSRAHVTLGEILKQAGSPYDALRAFDLAAGAAHNRNDPGTLVAIHYNVGAVCRRLGLEVEALRELATARGLLPGIAADMETSWVDRILSESTLNLVALGHDTDALELTESWLKTSTNHYAPYLVRGSIRYRQEGAAAATDDYVEAAIRAARQVASNASSRFRRMGRSTLEDVFADSLAALIDAAEPELAFGVLELSESSSVILTRDEESDPSSFALEGRAKLAGDVANLANDAQAAVSGRDRKALQQCQERADWLVAQGDLLGRSPMSGIPSRAVLHSGITRLQSSLSAQNLLLSYASVKGEIYVFVVTRNEIMCRPINATSQHIASLARSFRQECQGRFPVDALNELTTQLLDPVLDVLARTSSTTIIPSVELHGVPFHAMGPLFDRHHIAYATQAMEVVASYARRRRPLTKASSWTGLSAPRVDYADVPELPGVREEMRQIADFFDSPNYNLESPASSHDLLGLTGHRDVLHIACHGVFDPQAPLLSRLLLADRSVFAFEIMLAKLDVDQVILSSCETAESRAHLGGHLQSIASAFLQAGVRSVIGALWPVDDRTTMEFLTRLYDSQLQGGRSLAEGIREAQVSVRADESAQHPYFWAPFALFGAEGGTP